MPHHSCLFAQSPSWIQHSYGHRLTDSVKSWIYEPGSLTHRLRKQYGNRFNVRILRQYWFKPFINESRLLAMPEQRYALIREVLLQTDNQPLILARSIIPQQTIAVAQRNLSHLGTRPLGEVIFAYPNLERLAFEISLIPPVLWQAECRESFAITAPLWSRRTVYAIPTHPLLVSEIFMPGLLNNS